MRNSGMQLRGMTCVSDQIAADLARAGVEAAAIMTKGKLGTREILRISHEHKYADGPMVSVLTIVSLEDNQQSRLYGQTEVRVTESGRRSSQGNEVRLTCQLPQRAWSFVAKFHDTRSQYMDGLYRHLTGLDLAVKNDMLSEHEAAARLAAIVSWWRECETPTSAP